MALLITVTVINVILYQNRWISSWKTASSPQNVHL